MTEGLWAWCRARWRPFLRGLVAAIPVLGPAIAEVMKHEDEEQIRTLMEKIVSGAARNDARRQGAVLSLTDTDVEKTVKESILRLPAPDRERLKEAFRREPPKKAIYTALTALSTSTPVRDALLACGDQRAREASVLKPGKMIDRRYEIFENVGFGGMGAVYKAWDHQLGQSVALKFLHADLARDAAFVRRFLDEARTSLILTHPQIVRIRDVHALDGPPYISMEWVEGPTLRAVLLDREWIPWSEAEPMARGILGALAFAHRQKVPVLHLDVKPENIILPRLNAPKLCDFGLAHRVAQHGGQTLLPGAGTPEYMAPEQSCPTPRNSQRFVA